MNRICQKCGNEFPYVQKTNIKRFCSKQCAELGKYKGNYELTKLQKANCERINADIADLVRADIREIRGSRYEVVEGTPFSFCPHWKLDGCTK